jgi:hypothetical protein
MNAADTNLSMLEDNTGVSAKTGQKHTRAILFIDSAR